MLRAAPEGDQHFRSEETSDTALGNDPSTLLLQALRDTCRKSTDANAGFDSVSRQDKPQKELVGVPFGGALLWCIESNVKHALRDSFGQKRFILATRAESPSSYPHATTDDDQIRYQLIGSQQRAIGRQHREALRCLCPDSYSSRNEPQDEPGDGESSVEWVVSSHEAHQSLMLALPIDSARVLLSLYNTLPASSNQELPLLVALVADPSCDADVLGKMYLGSKVCGSKQKHHVIYQVMPQPGWVAKEDEEGCDPLPSLESILQRALESLRSNGNDLEYHVASRYEILSESLFRSTSQNEASAITMDFSWRGTSQMLSHPPASAYISLNVRSVCGSLDPDNHLPTNPLRQQLTKLTRWDEMRRQNSVAQNMDNDAEDTPEPQPAPTLEPSLVDEWLKEIREEGFTIAPPVSFDLNDTFDLDAATALPERRDLDFTERLWNFIKEHVETVADIVIVINAVIEELESGRLQPLVNKANQTGFARIIRDCYRLARMQTAPDYDEQKEAISRTFEYWLEQPLELVVEIGLWKLKRDSFHHLIAGGVASYDQLDASLDATLPFKVQVERHQKLLRVVELWSLVKSNILQMPLDGLRSLVQDALDLYFPSTKPTDDEHDQLGNPMDPEAAVSYKLSLPRFSNEGGRGLTSMIAGFEPSLWNLFATPSRPPTMSRGEDSQPQDSVFMCQLDRNDGLIGDRAAFNFDADALGQPGMLENLQYYTQRLSSCGNRWRVTYGTSHFI
ncbi:hypothetical protein DFS34DRAFT_58285 [Phlyctochytrium arcticum]|nr:hypothetical protein DFS34DRAFT_58285 [Phlyctochytrium arcticum]